MGLFKRKQFDPTTSTTANTTATHDDTEKRSRKKSVLNYVFPKSRVSEATLQVFRQLPGEIRHDPSMINFQREAERWNAEHADSSSIKSGREVKFYDEIEMTDNKPKMHVKYEDVRHSDDDSDEGQFITIKVTNMDSHPVDDDAERTDCSLTDFDDLKPSPSPHKKTVSIADSPPTSAADHHEHFSSHHPKVESPFHEFGKIFFLVFIWILMTLFLTSTPEKKIVRRQLVIPIDEPKFYNLPRLPNGTLMSITIQAPFLPNQREFTSRWKNRSVEDPRQRDNSLTIFLRTDDDKILTPNKTFYLYKPGEIDSVNATNIEFTFDITEDNLEDLHDDNVIQAVIVSNFSKSSKDEKQEVPIMFSVDFTPINKQIGVLFATFTLILLYVSIIWEIVHRTFAAIIASTLSLALLAALNDRPTHEEIMGWIDVETILLLFAMMILVGILTETGVFDHLAVYAYRVTNGQIWPLIHCLCIITSLISMLLDNVTTVLLMAPITITLCEDMDLNPVPILMAIVIHANIGGCATPIGDPPNIITTNPVLIGQGVNFLNFTLHMLVGTVIITITTNIHLRFIYNNINILFIHEPKDVKVLKKNILTWERALRNSISPFSKDADLVRQTLVKKIKGLRQELKRKMSKGVVETTRYRSTLEEMEKAYPIKKKGLLIKSGIALIFILVLFFVQSIPEIHRLSLGWSALIGILFLLIISGRDDMEAILHRVEWPTLLFFAAMFVLMEAVERMGFIAWIGSGTESLIKGVSKDYRLAVAIIIILWVSALTSAFVESLPVTQMMVKIVISLAANPKLGLPIQPLVWAMAFGPALGGNGTLVGASANIICAGIAEQHGYRMTFMDFLKFGFPIMLTTVLFTNLYIFLFTL